MSLEYKGENWLNKKVGNYTVIGEGSPVKYKSQNHEIQRWKVQCDCGTIKELSKWHLVYGKVTGCESCVRTRIKSDLSKNWNSEAKNVTGMYFGKIKDAAKKRNIPFEITREYMDEVFQKQNGKCAYTNMNLYFETNGIRGTASLDRIDNTKGYIPCNIQWIHKHVNTMKWDLSENEFLNICKIITENMKI
jgi:hypothetical protein